MNAPNLMRIGPPGNLQVIPAAGRSFSVAHEEGLTRQDRAASGLLREERIVKKHIFNIPYETAPESTIEFWEAMYDYNVPLAYEYQTKAGLKTTTVLMSSLPDRERLVAVHGGLWGGWRITLREV
jgi:hypothetical protein